MKYVFYLIDWTSGTDVTTEIEEPVGWDGAQIGLTRNKEWHGVFIDTLAAQVNKLKFYREARTILENAFGTNGIEAHVELKVDWRCDGEQDVELYKTKLLFTVYKSICGLSCFTEIGGQNNSCLMDFKMRYDTKVNLDSLESFGGTSLGAYAKLGTEIVLPSKGIYLALEASNDTTVSHKYSDDASWTFGDSGVVSQEGAILPILANTTRNDIVSSYVEKEGLWVYPNIELGIPNSNPPPEMMNLESFGIKCKSGTYDIAFTMNGHIEDFTTRTRNVTIDFQVWVGPDADNAVLHINHNVVTAAGRSGTATDLFNFSDGFNVNLQFGDKIWIFFKTQLAFTVPPAPPAAVTTSFEMFFEAGTSVTISTTSFCEDTPAKMYLVNEVMSRIAESITDDCMRVYSDYFGREDAEPYTSDANGCGSFEALTKGLFIRQAKVGLTSSTDPLMSLSFKDVFDALNCIHNIGIGIEPDPNRAGYDMLRVEPMEYFYKSDILMQCDGIKDLVYEVEQSDILARFKIGYEKWELEEWNVKDEFMTQRNYRSNIKAVNNEKELLCKFIAGGYAIEYTRRQGSSTKDWRYDNDYFIICLISDYSVEQGTNTTSEANIFDPDTVYNYRISPARNAMRWLKSILNSYVNFTGADSKFVFVDGTGNYLAEWLYTDAACQLDSGVIAENADLDYNLLDDVAQAEPVFTNALVKFDYPLSKTKFLDIMANPSGIIQYRCGNGALLDGYLFDLKYVAEKGMANFTLKPKYI